MASTGLPNIALLSLFILIMAIWLVPLSWMLRLGTQAPLSLLIMQVIAYGVLIWGTPAYYNISTGLLLMLPAILINGWLTIRFMLRKKHATRSLQAQN